MRTSDGSALPSWLGFDGTTRKFTIAEDAVGVVAATYQISVVVVDNGSPQLRDSETFALTVVEAGVIETVAPGVLERTAQSQALSVRLSAQPDKQVTVSLVVDAAVAAVAPNELVFDGTDWNTWQAATVSISAATYESKDDIDFVITASIHNAANSDELYLRTDTVEIAATYEGPGNRRPQITTSELRFNENAGAAESATGTVIGMVEATDADNDDNALVYSLEPLNTIFGINAGSGQVTISAARNFNYESGPREYPLTVKVVDPYGDSVKREVNVVITDINEAPVLAAIANDRAIIGHGYELILPAATDEDTGQSYTYTAVRTSDGSALPSWLGFDGTTRKFTIAEDAVGVVAATYQISVVVVDNGSPQLRDSETFALTVVEAGVIETVAPQVLERTAQSQALSVRLSAQPDKQVTVSLVVDAAVAAVAPNELVFTPSNWNGWQAATVSISSATYDSKDDIDFVINASIHEAANSDELYLRTDTVEIAAA